MDAYSQAISTNEFWSSVGFWILVGGLIGDIIVLKVPRHREGLEKVLAGLFTIIIIIGVAIEHKADKNISLLVSQQESETSLNIKQAEENTADAKREAARLEKEAAEIQASVAPRRLTDGERTLMSSRLASFKGAPVVSICNPFDVEECAFASEILSALHKAGWNTEPNWGIDRRVSSLVRVPAKTPTGVLIAPRERASIALVSALSDAGFDAIIPEKSPVATPDGTVIVDVEARPNGPQGEAKLRLQKEASTRIPAK